MDKAEAREVVIDALCADVANTDSLKEQVMHDARHGRRGFQTYTDEELVDEAEARGLFEIDLTRAEPTKVIDAIAVLES